MIGKRITILYPISDLARDGAQRQLLELVKGLDKKRFRPIVLSLQPSGAMEAEFRDVADAELLILDRKRKFKPLIFFEIVNIIRRMRVDIIQPFLTPATFFGLLSALVCRTPVKIITERASAGRTDIRFGHRLYLTIENLLSRFVDLAIANSESGRNYLIQRGFNPGLTRVIYNGLNFERLYAKKEEIERVKRELGVPLGGKVIGMVARLFPQKRHDVFLRAASIVSASIPEVRFVLVGGGPLAAHLQSLSRELGIAGKVRFVGEQKEVGPYLSAFDVAVLLSDAEGCSNSILEAMSLAKPVVATNVGGNRELIESSKTGFLVPSGNEAAVAEAILGLIHDPVAANDMGARAKEIIVSKFTIDSMVKQYQTIYEETLRTKGKGKKTVT